MSCPNKANDRSVKLSQGDLLLCPDCEEFRFPSLNPGNRKVTRKQTQAVGKSRPESGHVKNSLKCDTCHGIYLGESLGINEASLQQFSNIVNIFGWVCAACRDVVRNQLSQLQSGQNNLNSAVDQLTVDVSQLKKDVQCLKRDSTSASHIPDPIIWPSTTASKEYKKQLLAVVHTDLDDSKRRQCNLVVSGLVPCTGINDVDLFLDVCENNLSTKPFVVRNKCRRLGQPQTGKIQPVLICLDNTEAAISLLKASKQLRRSDDAHIRQKVFFNPDLTQGEAQAAFERRQRRRQRQQQEQELCGGADGTTSSNGDVVRLAESGLQSGVDVNTSDGVVSADTATDSLRKDSEIAPQLHSVSRTLSASATPFALQDRVPSVY
jgi:outer membrane murein-binding lipoprotein Lpp